MFCLDRTTGEVVWGPERVPQGIYSASPVIAGGKIYVTSEEGRTTVLEATDTFKIVAEGSVEQNTLASLAVADGRMLLRTAESLYSMNRAEP